MDSRQTRLAALISIMNENTRLNSHLTEYVEFAVVYRGDILLMKEAGMNVNYLGRGYYEVETEYGNAYVEVVG